MKFHSRLHAVLSLCVLLVIAGCAAPQAVRTYHDDPVLRSQLDLLRTTDASAIQQRWGDLGRLADKSWVHDPGNRAGKYGMDIRWIVPGAVMHITFAWCDRKACRGEWTAQFNHGLQRIDYINADGKLEKLGTVSPDGALKVTNVDSSVVMEEWKHDVSTNTMTLKGLLTSYQYAEVPREQLVALLPAHFQAIPSAPPGSIKTASTSLAAAMQPKNQDKSTKSSDSNKRHGAGSVSEAARIEPDLKPGARSRQPVKLINHGPYIVKPAGIADEPDASQSNAVWEKITCDDAAFGGVPVFRCNAIASAKNEDGRSMYFVLKTWGNSEIQNIRMDFSIEAALRLATVDDKKILAAPLALKVDGRMARQFAPADFISFTGYDDMVHGELPLTEALLKELSSADEFSLEATGTNGGPVVFRFLMTDSSRAILARMIPQTRAAYKSFYGSRNEKAVARKEEAAENNPVNIWKLIREGASRSEFWTSFSYGTRNNLELKALESGKTLRMRRTLCENGICAAPDTWTLRLQPNSIVSGELKTVFMLYNEANKPVLRYERVNRDGRAVGMTYDPIIEGHLKRSKTDLPITIGKPLASCCISIGIREYTPVTASEVQALIAQDAANERNRIANIERQENLARTLAQARQTRADRGPPADPGPQRSFMETLATTVQQELQAKNARDARAQESINRGIAAGRARAEQASAERQISQRDVEIRTPQPSRHATAPTQVASAGNDYSSRSVSRPARSPSSSERVANLIPTPEAITVCTLPSGANGSFECRSPVTVHRGNKNDISGHRTPDEMVMNLDGCPNPRRLASASHLVWGCGFGATNNSNSLDRSAGVDVKGRNTYYCHPKEVSCRKTQP